jgi:hypothetical protein
VHTQRLRGYFNKRPIPFFGGGGDCRSKYLESWLRLSIAKENGKFHSNPSCLKIKLSRTARRLGDNVAKGDTIREIRREMMTISSDANNILDSRYSHLGMATAKASDGELCICQILCG